MLPLDLFRIPVMRQAIKHDLDDLGLRADEPGSSVGP
jgi:hypothetical protein